MRRILITLSVVIIATAINAQQGVTIIVNNSNTITSISKVKLSNIFLKKTSKFDNGVAAAPVDLGAKSKVRESFSTNYLNKSVSAVKNYWNQQLFSGAAVPPPEKSSDAEVIAFVKANSGAIGYISSGTNASGVKVISVK